MSVLHWCKIHPALLAAFLASSSRSQTYEDVVQGKPFVGHDFFRVGVGENGKYTSEDYWFSTSWRKIGGRIYLNPYLRLGHIGQHTFNGNLARMGTEAL